MPGRRSAFLLMVPSLLVAVPRAAAQQPQPDTARAIPIPGVTVSVLRMPMEITRAPYAVSVAGEPGIRRARPGLGLDEALVGVPGVQVDNRYNYALGERISIRGFGARAQFGVRGIRVVVDGIPATFPDGQTALSHVDPGLLRRAEVIRGPASALYGNTAGGVIQLETESAPAGTFSQEVGLTAGADGLLRMDAGAGGRSRAMDYLLSVSRLAYGGFREHGSAEKLRLNAKIGYRGERDRVRLTISGVDYDARNPGSLSRELLAEDRSQAYGFNLVQQTGEEGRQGQMGVTWTREGAAGGLELSAYGISRTVANPIPPAIIDLDRTAAGFRALVRRDASLPLDLRWTAGVDADVQLDDRRNHANVEGERGGLTLDQRERVTNLAAFAQLDAALGPRLTLVGGLRYDWFRFSADDRLVTAGNPDDSGRRVMDALSPSIGASYRLGDPLTLYANIATSFETPTTTELTNRPTGAGGINPGLEPQDAVSLEIGGRGSAGSWLSYAVALYRADVRNALIPFQVPEVEGRDFFRNAGSAIHRGAELSATVSMTRGARVRAAYSYIDARFEEYSAGGDVYDGNRIPGIAPHRLEMTGSYDSRTGWFVALDGRYVAEMPVDDANEAASSAYWLADLRGGLERFRLGTLDVAPFAGISNLFDREYNTSVTVNAFGARYYEPGPGRAVYGGVKVRIGGMERP